MCRYITRPAFSDQREQLNAAGQAEFRLNTPRRGTTHLVMSPLEFMQRLAGAGAPAEAARGWLPDNRPSPVTAPGRVVVVTNGCFSDTEPERGPVRATGRFGDA